MTIEFQLQENEYVAVMLKRTYLKVMSLSLALVSVLGFIFFFSFETGDLREFTHPLVIGVALITLLIYPVISLKNRFKSRFRSSPFLQEEVRVTVEQGFIGINGESVESRFELSKLHKIVELKDWFLLYLNRNEFKIIPKHAFGENLPQFKSIIKTYSI